MQDHQLLHLPSRLLHHLILTDEEKGSFWPIDLRCLHPEMSAPCDLYLRVGRQRYTLFACSGLPFVPADRDKLMDSGVNELYIREDDAPVFYQYLKVALSDVVRSPTIASETKAEFVHAACRDIMEKVYREPRAVFIERAHEVIWPAVDLVVRDDRATRCMVQLTAHDVSTYTHCTNVGIFSIALARLYFGPSALHDLRKLATGFFLHDLGKCQVPTEILNKPGPLDTQEWQVVRQHPQHGHDILSDAGFMTNEARTVILEHHEKDDGSGYPGNLSAREIHPYARICRLADVYEALTSDRSYHQRRSTFEALKIMKEQVLADMDRQLFEHFIRLFRP